VRNGGTDVALKRAAALGRAIRGFIEDRMP
jgi:hypothetical protein